MCGIAGIICLKKDDVFQERLKAMTDIINYRGPDAEGQWISKNGLVGLGHRRLSVIDLSSNGNQPMHYLGRYSIVFNGEIYNYIELKQRLIQHGYVFQTESDTEVLMALYAKEKENCLSFLDGMFSFVIYDNETNEIFAARDRFGEKPELQSLLRFCDRNSMAQSREVRLPFLSHELVAFVFSLPPIIRYIKDGQNGLCEPLFLICCLLKLPGERTKLDMNRHNQNGLQIKISVKKFMKVKEHSTKKILSAKKNLKGNFILQTL